MDQHLIERSPGGVTGESTYRRRHLSATPFFLVGTEHSGTTLTGLMLDHHPMVSFLFDVRAPVEMMVDLSDECDRGANFGTGLGNADLGAAKRLIADKINAAQLFDRCLEQKRRRDRTRLVGASVRRHFDDLMRIWPEARFIHIVRDGRDVAWSAMDKGLAGNTFCAVENWLETETQWSRLRSKLPPEFCTEIQYEALVTQPEATLMRLCEFLGIPYHQAMLSYPKDTSYGPPSPHAIGRWRRKLSPDSIRLCEARIGDMLVERGYQLSGLPALELTPLLVRRLRRHNAFYNAVIRWYKYGTGLCLADFVTRWIGPRAWRLRVQDRMARRSLTISPRQDILDGINRHRSRWTSIIPTPYVLSVAKASAAGRGISQVGTDGRETLPGDGREDSP
jgi:Sulfotransferase family